MSATSSTKRPREKKASSRNARVAIAQKGSRAVARHVRVGRVLQNRRKQTTHTHTQRRSHKALLHELDVINGGIKAFDKALAHLSTSGPPLFLVLHFHSRTTVDKLLNFSLLFLFCFFFFFSFCLAVFFPSPSCPRTTTGSCDLHGLELASLARHRWRCGVLARGAAAGHPKRIPRLHIGGKPGHGPLRVRLHQHCVLHLGPFRRGDSSPSSDAVKPLLASHHRRKSAVCFPPPKKNLICQQALPSHSFLSPNHVHACVPLAASLRSHATHTHTHTTYHTHTPHTAHQTQILTHAHTM